MSVLFRKLFYNGFGKWNAQVSRVINEVYLLFERLTYTLIEKVRDFLNNNDPF